MSIKNETEREEAVSVGLWGGLLFSENQREGKGLT